jgi:hypothetical protein
MHKDDDILNEIVETTVAEGVPLYVAPKRWTAFKTALAYWKTMRAAAVAVFPALAVSLSGQTTISQVQLGKPEEHQASHADAGEATLEGESLELVSATANHVEPGYIYKTFKLPPRS